MDKNIIILGNSMEWCQACLVGLTSRENTIFFNGYPTKNKLLKALCVLQFNERIKRHLHLPFEKVIYNSFDKIFSKYADNAYFIFYDWNMLAWQYSFLQHIKKKYRNIKLIYIFTNIAKYSGAVHHNYIEKLNEWYDVVFAFDPVDAKRYNFAYSPLIYDADEKYVGIRKEKDTVFYIGRAKDRYDMLIKIYEKLCEFNVECDFHISGVSEENQKYSNKISFNKFMSYESALKLINESSCLVDVIQGDSTGLTIKTCEAVCYDKKLITTNKHVKEYSFYDSRYIRVIETPEDIDELFFLDNRDVHYSDEGKRYFSADKFLERIEEELNKREDNL